MAYPGYSDSYGGTPGYPGYSDGYGGTETPRAGHLVGGAILSGSAVVHVQAEGHLIGGAILRADLGRIRWILVDPLTSTRYRLPIGPAVQETLDRQHAPIYADLTASGPIVLLGQLAPSSLTFTGTLIDQEEYVQLTAFAAKDYPVQIIDDRLVIMNVLVTDWTPVREWKALYPWYHTWTLKVLVLDEAV